VGKIAEKAVCRSAFWINKNALLQTGDFLAILPTGICINTNCCGNKDDPEAPQNNRSENYTC